MDYVTVEISYSTFLKDMSQTGITCWIVNVPEGACDILTLDIYPEEVNSAHVSYPQLLWFIRAYESLAGRSFGYNGVHTNRIKGWAVGAITWSINYNDLTQAIANGVTFLQMCNTVTELIKSGDLQTIETLCTQTNERR